MKCSKISSRYLFLRFSVAHYVLRAASVDEGINGAQCTESSQKLNTYRGIGTRMCYVQYVFMFSHRLEVYGYSS